MTETAKPTPPADLWTQGNGSKPDKNTGGPINYGTVTLPGFGQTKGYGRYDQYTPKPDLQVNSVGELKNLFTTMFYNKDSRLINWMKKLGVTDLNNTNAVRYAREVWNDGATYAFQIAAGGQSVNFFEIMGSDAFQQTGLTIPKSLLGDSGSGQSPVQSYKTVTDPRDIRASLREAMMATLYREPTEAEYKQFVKQFSSAEKKYSKSNRYDPKTGVTTTSGAEFDRENFLTNYVLSKVNFKQDMEGAAGQVQDTVRQLIRDNGLNEYTSDNKARNWMRQVLAGDATMEQIQANIRNEAKLVYTAFTPMLDSNPGLSLVDVASGYLKTYANMLELDSSQMDIKDALLKASQSTENGQGLMSLLDYEKSLRKDARFQYTKRANEEASTMAQSFARAFGVSV